MAYDPETGEEIEEPEEKESESATAESPVDIGEYIRRARLQSALYNNAGLPSKLPEPIPQTTESPGKELYQPGPAMAAYKEALGAEPLRANYRPSGLRRFTSAVGGLAAGIAGGPEAGQATQQTIQDQPYARQLQNYQQGLGVKAQQAQLEAGGNQAARQYYLDLAKIQHEQAQAQAEQARREAERSHGLLWQFQTSPEHHAQRLEEIAARPGSKPDLVTVTTNDGKKQTGDRMPGGAVKVGDVTIPPNQIKSVRKVGTGAEEARITNPFELWLSQHPEGTATDYFKEHPEHKDDLQRYEEEYRKQPGKESANFREILRAYSADKEQPQKPPVVVVPGPEGTLIPKVASFGQPLPAGTTTTGGMSTEAVQENKRVLDEKKAIEENQKSYILAQQFAKQETGPGDVALTMQFMGAVKPENIGKIRFNKGEQDFIIGARDAMGDLDALLQKVSGGGKLAPKQRQQMLDTLKIMASPTTSEGGTNTGTHVVPKVGETFNGQRVLKVTEVHK